MMPPTGARPARFEHGPSDTAAAYLLRANVERLRASRPPRLRRSEVLQ